MKKSFPPKRHTFARSPACDLFYCREHSIKSDHQYKTTSLNQNSNPQIQKITMKNQSSTRFQLRIIALAMAACLSIPISHANAQNIFALNLSSDTISEFAPNGTLVTGSFASGLSNPHDLAFDSSGNLYVATYLASGSQTILKVTPSGVVSTFATGLPDIESLEFDSIGNLYVGGDNMISRITPAGVVSTFVTVGGSINSLAFDGSDNLFAVNGNDGQIFEITPDGTVSNFVRIQSTSSFTGFLAFGSNGNLYASNVLGPTIFKITPAAVVSTFATGSSSDQFSGLASDSSGNLYATNETNNTISIINSSGDVLIFSSDPSLKFPTAIAISPVPEPSTWALLGLGIGALGFFRLRRRKA